MGSHPYLRTKPINGITSLSTNQSHYWNHSHFYTITLLMGSQQYLHTYPHQWDHSNIYRHIPINGITAISTDISPSMGSQQYLPTYPHQWDHNQFYRSTAVKGSYPFPQSNPINGITTKYTMTSSMGSQCTHIWFLHVIIY